jgi:tetratricopeptide (TPR) repeat protein
MLETIREYAGEQLDESGEADELRRRHAEHFLALAEEAEPYLRKESEESREWLDRFDPEHDNVRAALDVLDASGECQLALRLVGAVWWFWDDRSHFVEGRRRLESALRADGRPTAARARALNGAGTLAMNAGDVAAVRPCAEEALALHRALGDAWGTAFSAHLLGHATLDEGDLQRAKPLIEESVRLFREVGDQHHNLFPTHLLAWTYFRLGDGERARALWEDNLQRARATANRNIEALSLGALADSFAVEEGRVEDALSMLTEAYRIHRDLGSPDVQTAMDLGRLARGLTLAGRAVAATRVLASAEALYEEIGARARPINAERNENTLSAIRSQLDDSAFAEAWEQGRALSPDEAVALALEESADA